MDISRNPMNRAIVCLIVVLSIFSYASAIHAQDSLALNESTKAILVPNSGRQISGVYPDLTVYGIYSEKGGHFKTGHDECGIGVVIPWANKLWMVNYAPHQPRGSEHKLFSIDNELNMTIHPESVGGTPAGRMIHRESNQLLIAHYAINADGKVRAISPKDMPMRVTAIARHLKDPANMVYYIDMEGSIWEADVHSLAVKKLFNKPVPGWHGKGGYTAQGRLVVSNNGELAAGNYKDLLVGGPAKNDDEAGVLAEWDGETWKIIERRQFTDITGPDGVHGGSDSDGSLWAIGWDRRSLRFKLLENGQWHTYLLPKASLCNDAKHGWYTEWPRIREITDGRFMMDMHGMFFDFPKAFSTNNSQGIRPIGSHLRYVPDFCEWNGRLVLASDETSIQGNKLAGQPQTNLWFGKYEDLKTWGPASGYGGPWIADPIVANSPSDPFLIAGFDRRVMHLATRSFTASTDKNSTTEIKEPVRFTIQLDKIGNGKWTDYLKVDVPDGGYINEILPSNIDGTWLRFTTNRDCVATAFLHQTTNQLVDGDEPQNRSLFAGLADVSDQAPRAAWIYPSKQNRNLRVIAENQNYFEFTKTGFEFVSGEFDKELASKLAVKPEFTVDDASVILEHNGTKLRLPKGDSAFDKPFTSGWPRASREVESERHLANIHGTFYEVPLVTNGKPPAFDLMRPVSSHSKQITDFCSWNGLVVLAGLRADAKNDEHVFNHSQKNVGLWFGGIDDLWKLGKPVGKGGPWKNTDVKANEPSDPYLMTGYDRKSLSLSVDRAVTIILEIDFDHQTGWHRYKSFDLKPNQIVNFDFPEGFNAHWIRFQASGDCQATASLTYE